MAAEWWIKVKAPAPGADYRWLPLSPGEGPAAAAAVPADKPADQRPGPPPALPSAALRDVISGAAQLGGTGELTIVLLVGPDGAPALYVEGLAVPSWPVDHQGRAITASVVGRAQASGSAGADWAQPLARALWALTHPTAARQAALERVVRFGPAGVRVDPVAWQRCLHQDSRLPAPRQIEFGKSRAGSGRAALDEAVRDTVSALMAGTAGPQAPGLLLAVSPLIDAEWCARHQPWRAVGTQLPAHRSLREPGHAAPAARPTELPVKSGVPAVPGWAQVGQLLKAVIPMLALAALCSAVVLIVL